MDGTPRRRSTGAGSRGQHARRRWGHHAQQWRPTGFVKPTSTDESPTDVGEAAVAADGLGAASADREAAVEPDGGGAASAIPLPILLQAGESGRLALNLRTMPNPSDGLGDASAVAADVGGVADAVNVQRVPGGVEPCPCPLEDADGQDEGDERKSVKIAVTVSEFQEGDSVYNEERDLDDVESEGEAAVATEKEEKRSKRQPRDITPEQQVLQSKWAGRNDAEHVGNIGWLFGNWGKRP